MQSFMPMLIHVELGGGSEEIVAGEKRSVTGASEPFVTIAFLSHGGCGSKQSRPSASVRNLEVVPSLGKSPRGLQAPGIATLSDACFLGRKALGEV